MQMDFWGVTPQRNIYCMRGATHQHFDPHIPHVGVHQCPNECFLKQPAGRWYLLREIQPDMNVVNDLVEPYPRGYLMPYVSSVHVIIVHFGVFGEVWEGPHSPLFGFQISLPFSGGWRTLSCFIVGRRTQ